MRRRWINLGTTGTPEPIRADQEAFVHHDLQNLFQLANEMHSLQLRRELEQLQTTLSRLEVVPHSFRKLEYIE